MTSRYYERVAEMVAEAPQGRAGRRWLPLAAVLVSSGTSVVFSLLVTRALAPPGYFTKYLVALRETDPIRLGDYSPLYLAMVRLLHPHGGASSVLLVQVGLLAVAAGAVAWTVGRVAGQPWGIVAGLAAATYRPFQVYAAVLEPEALLIANLAVAIAAGVRTRERLAAGRHARFPAATAFAAVTLAGLTRPQWLLLLPVWVAWLAAAAPARRRIGLVVTGAAVGAALLGAPVVRRLATTGTVILMNPGPVFFEGNGPLAATGLAQAPPLVKLLEASVAGQADWAHVAYRQIAAAALGHPVGAGEANRYWTSLAFETLGRQEPSALAARFGYKALIAVSPPEIHDLAEAAELDRRLRSTIPWGFAVLLALLPLAARGRSPSFSVVAGPLAIAAVALLVQVVFYPSARQRLPLALGLICALPPALRSADPRRSVWPGLATGLLLVAATGLAAAPASVLAEARASLLLGAPRATPGERLAAFLDGRAWRPRLARMIDDVVLANEQDPRELRAERFNETVHAGPAWLRARARYLRARADVEAGQRDAATSEAMLATALDPGFLPAAALRRVLADRSVDPTFGFRPPGWDPLSARLAIVQEVAVVAGGGRAAALARPLVTALPDLDPRLIGVGPLTRPADEAKKN